MNGATDPSCPSRPWVKVCVVRAGAMMAVSGRDPGELYVELTKEFGRPVYERIDAPADREQKALLSKLSPTRVSAEELAGERIERMLSVAPGNGAAIGGLGTPATVPGSAQSIITTTGESPNGPSVALD